MWKAIIKLVEKWGCRHEWDSHKTMQRFKKEGDSIPYKVDETLFCKNCGKIKKISL